MSLPICAQAGPLPSNAAPSAAEAKYAAMRFMSFSSFGRSPFRSRPSAIERQSRPKHRIMKIVPFQNLPGEPPVVAIKTCYEPEPRIPSPWHRHRGHREANCYVAEGFAFKPNNQPVTNPWVAVRTTALDLRKKQ